MKSSKLPVGSYVRIDKPQLQTIVEQLRERGYRTVGPRLSEAAIVYDDIDRTGPVADRLPGRAGRRQVPRGAQRRRRVLRLRGGAALAEEAMSFRLARRCCVARWTRGSGRWRRRPRRRSRWP